MHFNYNLQYNHSMKEYNKKCFRCNKIFIGKRSGTKNG